MGSRRILFNCLCSVRGLIPPKCVQLFGTVGLVSLNPRCQIIQSLCLYILQSTDLGTRISVLPCLRFMTLLIVCEVLYSYLSNQGLALTVSVSNNACVDWCLSFLDLTTMHIFLCSFTFSRSKLFSANIKTSQLSLPFSVSCIKHDSALTENNINID